MRQTFFAFLVLGLSLGCASDKKKEAAGDKIQVAAPTIEMKSEQAVPVIKVQPLPLKDEAKKPGAQPVPFQPKMVEAGLAVELLLDASGSMNGILGTETKWNLAVALLEDLLPQWQSLQNPPLSLGVRLFGSISPLDDNNCDDSRLLAEPGPIGIQELKKKLAGNRPQGKSPLAFALQKAAEDLKKRNEDRVILLLADGKDNCGQDPCQTAQQLYRTEKIITHVIGFDIAQEDEASLKCIAANSNGVFLLARTGDELLSSLDEALRSTIPYNLRIKTLVGGTPLPAKLTVYKTGTQQTVREEASFGIALLRLPPGAYDILVEYADSIAAKKPSKILKGVELTEKGKIEQEIRFDLAGVTLAARNPEGKPTAVQYSFLAGGTDRVMAETDASGEEKTFFLEPGLYDLVARASPVAGREMTLLEPKIQIDPAQGFVKHFAFQTGTLILKGVGSKQEPLPLTYRVAPKDRPDAVIAEGQIDAAGGKIELPPGEYDIYVEAMDPLLLVQPKGALKGLAMEGGSLLEKTVTLAVGLLNLTAKKAEGKETEAEFKITEAQGGREVAVLKAKEGKASVGLSPGKYQAQAFMMDPVYASPPATAAQEVTVEEGKTAEAALVFQLGTLRLLGRNAKEQRLNTRFAIYQGGTEAVVAQAGPNEGWFEFALGAGNYDVRAEHADAKADPKPHVWLRDITVAAGSIYVREAVFTSAKLRLIGRGTNNEIVPVEFKLYEYGHDRPLISGATGQDWQSFDLIPGSYYIEASYLDDDTDQVLKKWITLKVGDNEFVEKELRF
ncbi:MAG: VWA domain-containing protein [Deltaproteobacteria bacterium]|nr:VWA domain-containing protein [Deltaproteobacteria bacterium]